ncbi:hypothetical protein MKW92_017102 [Papaver armeniacum]|nr:hypothetical protein MKW92_017102 [Papaver armeniacum]
MGVEEDRLSELCDPLLHHIFTFLPIKCVVATSILSKRWKDLWVFSPVLNIQEWRKQCQLKENGDVSIHEWKRQLREIRGLIKILNRVLLQSHPLFPSDLPTLKKFYLDYDSLHDHHKISEWFPTLIMRKVEELGLCIPPEFGLPTCLFTCETIAMLKLEMAGDLSVHTKNKVSTFSFAETISFPKLKILHLKHMVFVDENVSAQLFSNSPVLEELMLTSCYTTENKVLHVSAESLKRLFITNSGIHRCKLKIYSPNLQSLTYSGMPEDLLLTDHVFSSIVDADIDITFATIYNDTKRSKERQCGLKNLLGRISNVKVLHISASTLETFCYEGIFAQMPSFPDLRRLEMSSKLSCRTSTGLFRLLLSVPNLESFVIAQASSSPYSISGYYINSLPGMTQLFGLRQKSIYKLGFSPFTNYLGADRERVPECLSLQLKVVEVREFDGKLKELDIISYFLINSLVLQTMTIAFPSSLPQYKRDIIRKTILMLPKGSTCSAINFLS